MRVFLPSRIAVQARSIFRAYQMAIVFIPPQVKKVSCIFLSGHRSIPMDIFVPGRHVSRDCSKFLHCSLFIFISVYQLDIGQYMQNLGDLFCISGVANALV